MALRDSTSSPFFSCVRRRDAPKEKPPPSNVLPHMFDDEPEPLVRARAYPKVQVEQPDIHELTTMEVGARPIYNQDERLPWWKVQNPHSPLRTHLFKRLLRLTCRNAVLWVSSPCHLR